MCEWTDGQSLRRHARAVEVTMRAAALKYGPGPEAVERWGITGMLHDADYEKWPEEHPKRIVAWLEQEGHADMAYAISAHSVHWGIPHNSPLDRALLACDELTGFLVACCYVRPDGITSLNPKSVRKKLKDKKFAAGVDREEVRLGAEQLGVELSDHIAFLIEALLPFGAELGIKGNTPA